jgi:uncharacterized protein (TIGR00251 family)
MIDLEVHPEGTVLPIHALPGARKNAILGARAGALRVAVTAAPEKGKANAAIQSVLADRLGCPKGAIVLISGETSRQKRFLIRGLGIDQAAGLLDLGGSPGHAKGAGEAD